MNVSEDKMKKSYGILTKMSGYMLAPLINAAISFISIPIMTALFPEEISGQISLFVTYQSIILSFALLGMDQSMSRYYFDPPGRLTNKSLSSICFLISLASFFVTMIVCLVLWKVLSRAIIGSNSILVIGCLLVDVLAHLILRFLNQASRLQDNMMLYVIQSICITVSTKISYIVIAYTSGKAIDAITVITVASVIFMIIFLVMKAKKTFSIPEKGISFQIKKIVMFGLPQIPVQLLATLNAGVSQIALERFSDYAAVGVYSVAVSVSNAIALIQSSINVIWAPYVYKNFHTKQKTIIRMHHLVSLVMIGAGLVLCLFEDLIYMILVDTAYWDSKVYFPLLIISPICYTISETLGIGFKIAEKSYWNILVYTFAFGINVASCCILIPIIGPIGAAISTAVSSIVMMIVKSFIGEKYYRCSDSYLKLITAFVSMCIAVCIATLFYNSTLRYVSLLGALIVTIVVYRNEINYLVQSIFYRRDKHEYL